MPDAEIILTFDGQDLLPPELGDYQKWPHLSQDGIAPFWDREPFEVISLVQASPTFFICNMSVWIAPT